MDKISKAVNHEQLNQLKDEIESLVTAIQQVRLGNKLDKMTQVRLVDLQYSAKLTLDQLDNLVDAEIEVDEVSNA